MVTVIPGINPLGNKPFVSCIEVATPDPSTFPQPIFGVPVTDTAANTIFLSSTVRSFELTLVVTPSTVKLPLMKVSPLTFKSLPTYNFLAIAAPPDTFNGPVVGLVESVTLVTSTVVNLPGDSMAAPIVILLMLPFTAGLIITLPSTLLVVRGCKLTSELTGFSVTVPMAFILGTNICPFRIPELVIVIDPLPLTPTNAGDNVSLALKLIVPVPIAVM